MNLDRRCHGSRGRGRYDSEGEFSPFADEGKDGYDAQSWVASQPWCDGNIGTAGASYACVTQWLSAPRSHPAIKAMVPRLTSSNVYEMMYHRGAFELATIGLWALKTTNPIDYGRNKPRILAALDSLPLVTLDIVASGRKIPFLRDWISHPAEGAYWRPVIVDDEYGDIDIPVLNIGGWYDIFATETVNNYVGMVRDAKSDKIRKGQRLLMGPWQHVMSGRFGRIGELQFGQDSWVDQRDLQLRWFDQILKGALNGILDEPPVRIFVMGENRWRNEQEWPLERQRATTYFLQSETGANSRSGDGALTTIQPNTAVRDTFTYDPANPVRTKGGALLGIADGPHDQGEIEDRPDVLVYSSAILKEPIEVTGHIKLILYASTDARSTDFTAKLVDVYPAGVSEVFHLFSYRTWKKFDDVFILIYDVMKSQIVKPTNINLPGVLNGARTTYAATKTLQRKLF